MWILEVAAFVTVSVCLGPICPGIWSYSPLDSWAKESYVVPELNAQRYCILTSCCQLSFFLFTPLVDVQHQHVFQEIFQNSDLLKSSTVAVRGEGKASE